MKKILFLFLLATQVSIAQVSPFQQRQLDSLLRDYTEIKQFSGVVLLAQGNRVLYQKAVGYASREEKIPNDLTTNFNIASMGKTFTATMIMQLVQEGKLNLRQNLATLLPEYKIKKADSITVQHLLTHTSGVGNYMMHPGYEKNRNSLKTLNDVMTYVTDQEPTMGYVGEKYDYSNSGFIILGRLIEKMTGKPYLENLKQRIFKPAGISNSYIRYPATFVAPQEATPYFSYTAKTFVNMSWDEFPAFSDGGMQSNAGDLYRFAKSLLDEKLLTASLRDSMWTGKVEMGRGQYGYGWIENNNLPGRKIFSHDGGGKGFSSDLKIVKEEGYIIVVLINNRISPMEISNNILNILFKGTYTKPVKKPEIVLLEKMEKAGFDYVKQHYSAILKEIGFDKTPDPWVYIRFSDILESLKRVDQALEVCAMGRKEFPEESVMYNVTGQLYYNLENYPEAANWFSQALKINAGDSYAQMMLEIINKKK